MVLQQKRTSETSRTLLFATEIKKGASSPNYSKANGVEGSFVFYASNTHTQFQPESLCVLFLPPRILLTQIFRDPAYCDPLSLREAVPD